VRRIDVDDGDDAGFSDDGADDDDDDDDVFDADLFDDADCFGADCFGADFFDADFLGAAAADDFLAAGADDADDGDFWDDADGDGWADRGGVGGLAVENNSGFGGVEKLIWMHLHEVCVAGVVLLVVLFWARQDRAREESNLLPLSLPVHLVGTEA
jgi:hypothetical protein